MTLNPAMTCLAVFAAGLLWATVEANIHYRHERRMMTPEEREADDEEMDRVSQEW